MMRTRPVEVRTVRAAPIDAGGHEDHAAGQAGEREQAGEVETPTAGQEERELDADEQDDHVRDQHYDRGPVAAERRARDGAERADTMMPWISRPMS